MLKVSKYMIFFDFMKWFQNILPDIQPTENTGVLCYCQIDTFVDMEHLLSPQIWMRMMTSDYFWSAPVSSVSTIWEDTWPLQLWTGCLEMIPDSRHHYCGGGRIKKLTWVWCWDTLTLTWIFSPKTLLLVTVLELVKLLLLGKQEEQRIKIKIIYAVI